MKSFLLISTITCLITITLAGICKDESGKNVEWYIVYKLPKLSGSDALKSGFSYAYITSETIKSTEGWKLSTKLVTDSKSMFGQTLSAYYGDSSLDSKYTHVMYSDAAHGEEGNGYKAHAKGVVVMDKQQGFWLSHSIPNFPPTFDKEYEYPASAANYGQTAICVSFKTPSEGEKIASHLLYIRPHVYSKSLLPALESITPSFTTLFPEGNKRVQWPKEDETEQSLSTTGGTKITGFARGPKAPGDLYLESLAPQIGADLYVETWRKGAGGNLPSDCSRNVKVYNIQTLELPFTKDSKTSTSGSWEYTQDHAKWAMSESSKKPVVCIGDINRMESQAKRGGGALCINNQKLWNTFRASVKDVQSC